MQYYSYENFLKDTQTLFTQINQNLGKPDAIIAIARGGLTLAHFLSLRWDLREVYTLNAISYNGDKQGELLIKNIPSIPQEFRNVLVVDEIVDSGKSLKKILEILTSQNPQIKFSTATLFQKPAANFQADFFIQEPSSWIDFFWEKDMF